MCICKAVSQLLQGQPHHSPEVNASPPGGHHSLRGSTNPWGTQDAKQQDREINKKMVKIEKPFLNTRVQVQGGEKKKYSWVMIIQKHVEPHEEPKTYRGK